MPEKRAADGALVLAPPQAKRARPAGELVAAGRGNQVMEAGPPRSSNMEAPIMLLTGHSGEVYTSKFHPAGNLLASAGYERQVSDQFHQEILSTLFW